MLTHLMHHEKYFTRELPWLAARWVPTLVLPIYKETLHLNAICFVMLKDKLLFTATKM